MKKIICSILCLSILLTGMIGITAASADVPVIITKSTITVTAKPDGMYATAKVPGAPKKSGYYSCAIIKLTVKFRPQKGPDYSSSNTKSQNGGWGEGTGFVTVSVKRRNPNDRIISAKADRTFQYYGIRND